MPFLVGLAVSPASAIRVEAPVAVRITATVDENTEDEHPEYDWVVSHRGTERRLFVRRLFVKLGDVSPGDVGRAVEPYRVNFHLAGQDTALQKLESAPAGAQVVIEAYLRLSQGARVMMLDSVEVAARPTPPAQPTEKP